MAEPIDPKKIKRVDVPSPTGAPEIRVLRLKGNQTIKGWILSDFLWGFMIHWNNGISRSSPHYDEPHPCEGCKMEVPLKELFYLHILSPQYGQVFVEMTPTAAKRVQLMLEGNQTYRGMYVEIKRTPADNGRLLVSLPEWMESRAALPESKDPVESLAKLWAWGKR